MAALQLQEANIAGQPADDHYAAGAPLLGDDEANNIANDDGHQADIDAAGGSHFSSWLPTFIGFLLLTFNSAMAIVRSQGDSTAIAFASISYAILVALFVCLRMYECARAGSAKRKWLKIAVWVLTTLLTFAFSYKVAAVMPAPVAVLVWLMAFATVAGGFFAFFIFKEKK